MWVGILGWIVGDVVVIGEILVIVVIVYDIGFFGIGIGWGWCFLLLVYVIIGVYIDIKGIVRSFYFYFFMVWFVLEYSIYIKIWCVWVVIDIIYSKIVISI